MKKIKLRLWNLKDKCFHYPEREGCNFGITLNGLVTVSTSCETLGISNIDEEGNQDYNVNLFTGLIDSDGKPIYEGDIIEWSAPKDKPNVEKSGLVTFSDNACYMAGSHPLSAVAFRSEIMGNIYENPQLLDDKIN